MSEGRIFLGDCLDVMKRLPDGSVDLIITSPPYNLGTKHHTGNHVFKSYNSYDDNMPEKEYQDWQVDVLNECYRVLKNTGSMMYNHKNRIRGGLQITPYEWIMRSRFVVKQEVVWFNRSQNFDKCRFYPMTERIYWLAKDPKTKLFNAINHHDVFNWTPTGTSKEFKRAFPVELVEDLMKCFPEAQVVLDPFMGSGTTGVACKHLQKNFIGIELDEKYLETAKKRLQEEA